MAEASSDARVSYPYMSAIQWFGIRARLKQSPPKSIDLDWIMATLDTTQKSAQNVLPQLRTLGLIDNDNRVLDIVHDLRDDETYSEACKTIVEAVYPESLRNAHTDPDADPARVAPWFARNAKTGDLTAGKQARTYLLLLGGKLPSPDDTATPKQRRKSDASKKTAPKPPRSTNADVKTPPNPPRDVEPPHPPSPKGATQPTLHVDLQIHISADAGDAQIDAIFKSMAKHLYGR